MFEYTQNRLNNSKNRVDRFIDENLLDWANEELVRPTQKLAQEQGYSEPVIQSIKVEKDGFMKLKFIWDYKGPEGQPIAVFLEKGTKKHKIRAKGKLYGGADFLRFFSKIFNKKIFRLEVNHPGFDGREIMKKGYDQNILNLKHRVVVETNNYLMVNRL